MYATTALSAALIALPGLVAAGGLRKHQSFHQKRAQLLQSQYAVNAEAPASDFNPQYLTNKTYQYSVNGYGLPEVNFDIGESYAGTLPIDDSGDNNFFFWFVPSTNPAAKDEITIWLNGGPGCSSLDGFFHENGPVIWQPGTYRPQRNPYAWSNLTNIVWVEQPVGTGFSTGNVTATDEIDVATQFRGFWTRFVDTFDLHNRKVYVTGESYAGQYVPYIADGFLNQTDKAYYDTRGILIYDPSISEDVVGEEAPTLAFVDFSAATLPFNDSFVSQIRNISATCGYDDLMKVGHTYPPAGYFPSLPASTFDASGSTSDACDIFDLVIEAAFEINPCFNLYQVAQQCPIPWDVLGFPYSDFYLPPGFNQPYFNRSDVKRAIHAPENVDWAICSNNPVFVNDTDLSPPSGLNGGPLMRVTEKTNNTIVGHGMLDMVLIMNGTLLTLNNLTWNGAQGFDKPPNMPFYVPYHIDYQLGTASGAGVLGSWTSARGLTFVANDLSGHEVPQFQASSAYRHLELLLGRIANLSDTAPFTTMPDVLQPVAPLGIGTAPVG